VGPGLERELVESQHVAIAAVGETQMLDALGVNERIDAFPHQLSIGQQQRVAIARALVNHPKLVLADEPTSNLDDAAAALAVDLLTEQAGRHGATLVVATHDARVKAKIRDRLELA